MKNSRWISALFGVPLVIAILAFGNVFVIDVAFAIITAISLHEYFNSFKGKANPIIWIGYVLSALIAFIHIVPVENIIQILGVLVPVTILIMFVQVILTNNKTTIKDISITLFGIFYIAVFLMFIPLIRGSENGRILIWYVMFAAWMTDTFAYLIGMKFGKHKFSQISPKKSIEGSIAGTVGATIVILIYTYVCNTLWGLNMSYAYITFVAIILSIIGQIGDLAASSIKRYVGIKDFSNLIPGHGGMLDRFDRVIFIAPFAYILLCLI